MPPEMASSLLPAPAQMQLETEKERVSLLETLLQTQKELADASQQLERLRQDMKVQKLKEQVWRAVLGREARRRSQPSGASMHPVRGMVPSQDNHRGALSCERGTRGPCPQRAHMLVAEHTKMRR